MRRRRPNPWILVPSVLAVVIVVGLVYGATAANYVTPTRAGISSHPVDANAMAPPECSVLDLQTIAWRTGGTLFGTDLNDLLIGSARNDRIYGELGDDCLVAGGGGNDRLFGGKGFDVCIGNATTTFDNCEVELRTGGP